MTRHLRRGLEEGNHVVGAQTLQLSNINVIKQDRSDIGGITDEHCLINIATAIVASLSRRREDVGCTREFLFRGIEIGIVTERPSEVIDEETAVEGQPELIS